MHKQRMLSKILSCFPKMDGQSIRREFKHAFCLGTPHETSALNEQELALILKLVAVIKRRKLTVPAAMFLECAQPLNYIGSQMMVFFRPLLTFFFTSAEYDLFQGVMEKREGIKKIVEELEKATICGKVIQDTKKDINK